MCDRLKCWKSARCQSNWVYGRLCKCVRIVWSGARWPKGNKNNNYNINDRCYSAAGIGTFMVRGTDSRQIMGVDILTAINKL